MSFELVEQKIMLPRELNEVRTAIVKVVSTMVSGQNALAAILGSMGELQAAVGNFQQIPVELKEDLPGAVAVAGLLGADILAALQKKPS